MNLMIMTSGSNKLQSMQPASQKRSREGPRPVWLLPIQNVTMEFLDSLLQFGGGKIRYHMPLLSPPPFSGKLTNQMNSSVILIKEDYRVHTGNSFSSAGNQVNFIF